MLQQHRRALPSTGVRTLPCAFIRSRCTARRLCHSGSVVTEEASKNLRDGEVLRLQMDAQKDKAGSHSCEWWRTRLTKEELQRIDVLTYLLGRYPAVTVTNSAAVAEYNERRRSVAQKQSEDASPARKATFDKSSTSTVPNREYEKPPLQSKKKKLAALNARSLPAKKSIGTGAATELSSANVSSFRTSAKTTTAGNENAGQKLSASRLWSSAMAQSSNTQAPDIIGPSTPVGEVEQLAQLWLRQDRRVQLQQAKKNAMDDATWQALLTHPEHLFADDAAVYARFGMGGYVSPHTKGFTGLFRQQWQDFHVTEMTTTAASGTPELQSATSNNEAHVDSQGIYCNARPVSRNFDFTIPALPSELFQPDENSESSGCAPAPSAIEQPDLSFFAVDVKQRIQELQAEDVREKDLAAAAAALSKENRRHSLLSPTAADSAAAAGSVGETEFSAASEKDEQLHVSKDERNLVSLSPSGSSPRSESEMTAASSGTHRHYLQCTLHKQHLAHGNALAMIAQTLRIHPRSISVAGIKDYIGDTVQRVRLENVSPAAALAANRRFRQKRLKMTLSDFSYESAPLSPGDLFGNHFRVVLRDVDVPKGDLADAIHAFAERGFPNYYGCQRFSWFAGRQDAAFALLRHNWLAFAFLFLNYTGKDRSLRELLQRSKKYPHPAQDEYRRGVVRRLRQISIEPSDLDVAPFLSCPPLNAPLTHVDGRPFSEVEELICAQLREAYFDLNVQSRRLTAQRLSSYLWNQVLTLRLHHVGGEQVLDGDLVAPAAIRQLSVDVDDRQDWYHIFGDCVSRENRHRYTIDDVVHPGFSFDAIRLPENVVGAYYEQVCGKYALDWMAQHSRAGLKDFREPPRPIIRKPLNLSYEYNAEARVLTLRFALERGSYANVALSELMKSVRCLGAEEVTVLPLPEPLWTTLGDDDPGYVTTLQDIYEGYEDGVGFMNDEAPVELAAESEVKVWDHDGPFFLPPSEDPFYKAQRWSSEHLLRNSERKAKEAEDMTRMLFDRPLAKQLKEGEVDTYAGHIVPLPPNASAKEVYAKVMRRKRRYAGSPRVITRMQRVTSPASHRGRGAGGAFGGKGQPAFQSLNKNSWNFTW